MIERRSGAVGPLEDAVRTQREAILKLLRDQLSLCCAELRDGYYSLVAKHGFSSNKALKNIVSVDVGSVSDKRIYLTQFLSALQKTGSFPWLESAMESLLHFDLDFDNTILPWIYGIDHFADFDPDYSPKKNKNSETDSEDASGKPDAPTDKKGREFRMVKSNISDKGSFQDQADYIFGWLQQKTVMITEELTSPAERKEKLISGISIHVARTMEANYDSFVYRFIWGKTVEKEWKRFAGENKTVFWRKEYEESAAKSQVKKDWDNALSDLSGALASAH